MKIITAIKCAYYWDKALYYASKGNRDKAFQYLENMHVYLKGKDVGLHLLIGYLHSSKREYDSAITNGELAIKLIYENKRFSINEKNYLTAYAASFCIPSFIELGKDDKTVLYYKFLDYNMIDLSKVKPSLKRSFPLSSHPNWDCKLSHPSVQK